MSHNRQAIKDRLSTEMDHQVNEGCDMISPMKPVATLVIEADASQLEKVRQFVKKTADTLTADTGAIDDLILAVDEAVTNIILHGYKDADGRIKILLGTDADALIVTLYDNAPAYDPRLTPTPKLDIPLEQRTPGGLGVHLMRQLTDKMDYRRTPDGENELTLIKRTESEHEHHL